MHQALAAHPLRASITCSSMTNHGQQLHNGLLIHVLSSSEALVHQTEAHPVLCDRPVRVVKDSDPYLPGPSCIGDPHHRVLLPGLRSKLPLPQRHLEGVSVPSRRGLDLHKLCLVQGAAGAAHAGKETSASSSSRRHGEEAGGNPFRKSWCSPWGRPVLQRNQWTDGSTRRRTTSDN